MREIIFRGIRVDNGEWVEGHLFCIWEKSYICWGTTNGSPNMIEVLPNSVGQWTGILDRKGVRVFEGDIAKCACIKDGVKYHESIMEIPSITDYCFYAMLDSCPLDEQEEFEVIGSIHQHPHLLKGGEDE